MLKSTKTRRLGLCTATLACLAFTAAIGQTQTPEKFLLRDRDAVGDVSETVSTMEMDLTIKATAPNLKLAPMQFKISEREQEQEEVLAVTAAGKVDGFRRTYKVNRKTETSPDKPVKTTVSPLEGKTVAVRRHKGRLVVTVAKGSITNADRKKLTESLDRGLVDFFPQYKVAVGQEWKVPTNTLTAMFSKTDSATASGRLLEFVTYENQRCAKVRVMLNLATKLETGITMTMKLSGDLYQSMETLRPITFSAEGPITVSGVTKSPKGKIVMSGGGTMKMEMVTNWIKIAGKTTTVDPVIVVQ